MQRTGIYVLSGLALLSGAFLLVAGINGNWDTPFWRAVVIVAGALAVIGALMRLRRYSRAADIMMVVGCLAHFVIPWTIFGPLAAILVIALAFLDIRSAQPRRSPSV